MNKLILLILFLVLSGHGFSDVYIWVDDAGRVHNGDKSSAMQESKRLAGEKITSYDTDTYKNISASSGATNKSSSSKNGKVIMYSTAWCGYCKKARQYFKSKGISFVEYDIEKKCTR